jgi:hypothetical protein
MKRFKRTRHVADELGAIGPILRRTSGRATFVAPACIVVGLMLAVTSSASVEGRAAENAMPKQIWAVVIGPKAIARVQAGTLKRLRARGINMTVAARLSEGQAARLRKLSARAKLISLKPSRRGSCRRSASICAVEARSIRHVRRMRRKPAVDLVVVRIPGPGALRVLPTPGRRILAVAKLRGGRFDVFTWRRAIERAADSPGLDLAVEPVGRAGDRALTLYLNLLAVVHAGTQEPASPPSPQPPPPPPVLPPPGPTPGSVPATLTLQDVDGGLAYYARFSNGLPTDASYFPVGGWLRRALDPEHFGDYANFGMNLFVGVEGPELTNEAMIRANGMKAIVQSGERTRFDDVGSETAGWLLFDEVDMAEGPGTGYSTLESILAGLPQDGRLRYNNYGKGVLEWESDAEAARFINGPNGSNGYQQVVSTDYYWFTDPNARDNPRYGFGSSYGDDVSKIRRLDALDGVRQPVWHFVELGWPASESAAQGGRRILPEEIRSAVWHALIAGGRGIIYFDHNFGPDTPGSTILEEGYEDNRVAASQVNAQIKALASVLNAPFVTSGHSATDTMDGTVRYMVKWSNGLYLFAGADRGGGNATFSIPCVGNTTAIVEGENRSMPVTGGSFTDQFADNNAIHIYRILGGAAC